MIDEFNKTASRARKNVDDLQRDDTQTELENRLRPIKILIEALRDRVEDTEAGNNTSITLAPLTPSSDLEDVKRAVNEIISYLSKEALRGNIV